MVEVFELLTDPVQGIVPDVSELYTIMAINSSKLIQLIIRSLHNDFENTQPTTRRIVADRMDTMGPT